MKERVYTAAITLLAAGSIVLLILDFMGTISLGSSPFREIDVGILLVFAIDYVVRFVRAEKKLIFVRENIPDLLAIIPFNTIFSAFRVFRAFRLLKAARAFRFLRAGAFFTVLRRRADGILRTNGLIYLIYTTGALIVCSSIVMMYAEKMTFADALWWSFVTCTTVGYGDISPSSTIGRAVAVVLMLFGIGLLGMLTGSITTYFTRQRTPADATQPDDLEALIAQSTPEEREKLYQIAVILMQKEE